MARIIVTLDLPDGTDTDLLEEYGYKIVGQLWDRPSSPDGVDSISFELQGDDYEPDVFEPITKPPEVCTCETVNGAIVWPPSSTCPIHKDLV